MKISSNISYNNSNTTFNGGVATNLRLKDLRWRQIRKDYRDVYENEPLFVQPFLKAMLIPCRVFTYLFHSKELKEIFNSIKDKSGNVSKDVYKIGRNFIDLTSNPYDVIPEFFDKLKQNSYYDKNVIQKIKELPKSCVADAPRIIEETKTLPDDMQKEIFEIFRLHDEKFHSTPVASSIFCAIKDKYDRCNMTLIKAVQAFIRNGIQDSGNNEYLLRISDIECSNPNWEWRNPETTEILKKAWLTPEDVINAKNGKHITKG